MSGPTEFTLQPVHGPEGSGFDVYRRGERVDESHLRGGAGLYYSRAKGSSYTRPALWEGDFDPGMPVALVAESSHPRDPNAIAIWDFKKEWRVGYLSRAVAQKLSPKILEGQDLRAYVLKVEGYRADSRPFLRRAHLRVLVVDRATASIDLPTDPAEPLPDAPALYFEAEQPSRRRGASPESGERSGSGCATALVAIAAVGILAVVVTAISGRAHAVEYPRADYHEERCGQLAPEGATTDTAGRGPV